ncbi:hypothetical protein SELMODRAFT_267900 [Selaginella moellendorffii]|uniref:Cyclase family protein n=1 Tax=Selaginella moellendorffii TaxID=88036 RepID=D8RYK9_SELML|nr:uncharacterized protein LOC9645984 [Selaginella moellendorffii]EFJ22740.1 hypothetical protein SELMODRAFT_267900 [Selaginella moellendorffii]|eukprot:XP_002975835.1 uncharacterized protein LOC9645984 [Selaginella moellendorffii]
MELCAIVLTLVLVLGAESIAQSEQWCTSGSGATNARIIDITHSFREGLPVWESFHRGLGKLVHQVESIANGSIANGSELKKMGVHTGTHVDSPSHFLEDAFLAGVDTSNGLDLGILNGPVLVVEAPRETNISGSVIKEIVPQGVKRVLFRTLNTDRRLMWKPEFVTDYTAITGEGAEYIAEKTQIKLVGVDYLSAAVYEALARSHKALLRKGVILVEGLNLDNVDTGMYTLHCLPLRLVGSDGSPTRCILTD